MTGLVRLSLWALAAGFAIGLALRVTARGRLPLLLVLALLPWLAHFLYASVTGLTAQSDDVWLFTSLSVALALLVWLLVARLAARAPLFAPLLPLALLLLYGMVALWFGTRLAPYGLVLDPLWYAYLIWGSLFAASCLCAYAFRINLRRPTGLLRKQR